MQKLRITITEKNGRVVELPRLADPEALFKIFGQMLRAGYDLRAGKEDWVGVTATVIITKDEPEPASPALE